MAKRQRGSEDAEEDGDIEEATTQREEGEPPIEVPEAERELSEAQPSRGLKAPDEPTPAQREEHCRTHIPFRVWCDICVRARGQASPHPKSQGKDDRYRVPQLVLDYWFMGGEGELGRDSIPVIVMFEKNGGGTIRPSS